MGVARSGLFPTVSANGAYNNQQIALGFLPPSRFEAFRATALVAVECPLTDPTIAGAKAAIAG